MEPYYISNLAIFVMATFILVALVNWTAVPMGLFMPCMMMGAGLGRL